MVTRNEPGSDHSKEPKNLQRFRLFSSYLSPFEAVGPRGASGGSCRIDFSTAACTAPSCWPLSGSNGDCIVRRISPSHNTSHATPPRTLHRAWGSTPPTSKRRALRFSVPPHGVAQAIGSRVCARRCAPSSDYSSRRVHSRAAGPAAPLISSTQNVRAAAGATGGGASLPSRRC